MPLLSVLISTRLGIIVPNLHDLSSVFKKKFSLGTICERKKRGLFGSPSINNLASQPIESYANRTKK